MAIEDFPSQDDLRQKMSQFWQQAAAQGTPGRATMGFNFTIMTRSSASLKALRQDLAAYDPDVLSSGFLFWKTHLISGRRGIREWTRESADRWLEGLLKTVEETDSNFVQLGAAIRKH